MEVFRSYDVVSGWELEIVWTVKPSLVAGRAQLAA